MSPSRKDAGPVTTLPSMSPLQSPASSSSSSSSSSRHQTANMPFWFSNFDEAARNRFLKDYRIQTASAVSTIISCLAVTPLENVKTRLQSHNFKGVSHCVRYMLTHEGPRGFTAGALPPLASLTIVRVTNFSVYQKMKYTLSDIIERNTGTSPLAAYNTPGSLPTLPMIACFTISGMVAGAVAAPIACPFELAKNVVQTSVLMGRAQEVAESKGKVPDRNIRRLGTLQAIKQIISRHGFGGLYTGMRLHIARDTLGTGLYFTIYETSKQLVSYLGDYHSPFGPPMVAGALSGVIPWICTYPLDTRKTRKQSLVLGKSKEVGEATKALAKSSVYRGLSVIIFRTAVQNMLLLSIFEYLKKEINML